ncbi:MAG: nucleoside-diphosphate sugar epimerase/dehydratase [Clostridiaceae bacterium]|nr:nucleoside-diphosphate sugar epimerase/dehydratase [Clostridiaceae bacterium]
MQNEASPIKTKLNRINIKMLILCGVDFIVLMISQWIALNLQLDLTVHLAEINILRQFGLLIAILALPIFYICGFYNQIWRYASIPQYLYILGGAICHTLMFAGILTAMNKILPATYYVIYFMLIFILLVGVRVIYRLLLNRFMVNQINPVRRYWVASHSLAAESKTIRVLVIGAGHAGWQIIREMLEVETGRTPVAIIDDDPNKQGLRILGIPVAGGRDIIPKIVAEQQVQEIIIALPSASREAIRELVELCNKTKCQLKILPMLYELINGKISIADIKEVDIEDLLGRQEIFLNTPEIAGYLENEVVLVTGGGGSIGSELCRQIARFQPKQLIVFDVYENNAYQLQYELQSLYKGNLEFIVLIGSVRDITRMDKIVKQYKPSVIFHAAAHKHVPLMEDSPGEAVKNNIIGTYNTALVAAQNHISHFVLISTDKAVNPTNVMGASKRIAEMTVQCMSRQYPATKFTAVRFGNVLGSNGSVIPLFKQQIKNDRRVTVTHPEITRYFMTIPEAARLVIQAGALADGGEIFVLDMGEPIKIADLARDLIRLSGLEPDVDVKIEYTGLRPGEKMYEELCLPKENMNKTRHDKIFVMKPVTDAKDIACEIEQLKLIIGWTSPEFEHLVETMMGVFEKGEQKVIIENKKNDEHEMN